MHKPPPEDEDDRFLRRFATPWEDIFARGLTSMRWYIPNRYFRSPNIIPLENFRPSGELRIVDTMRQREREREAAMRSKDCYPKIT